ncbi:MAG: hypothetical protein OXT49_11300 [Gammaproteobacteria bacterium]|nr:hypothetical protein [Gammaproteobacteria bacterium]
MTFKTLLIRSSQFLSIRTVSALMLSMLFASSAALASGTGGYGTGDGSGGGYNDYAPAPVDHYYEAGRAVFKGRTAESAGKTFCLLKPDGAVKKLKRKTLKPFKSGSANDLVKVVVECKKPSNGLETSVGINDSRALIYYLNKRFNLELY